MKRTELAAVLREEYKDRLPCGVEKVDEPGFENLWFVVPPAPPRELPRELPRDVLATANRVIENLPSYANADPLDKLISYLFSRREAVQSSRMEGTWSTIDQVLTPGALYDKKEGPTARASVLGYANALQTELERCHKMGPSVFSTDLACRLHEAVMKKDPHFKGRAGRLRQSGQPGSVVLIGGLRRKEESTYNPTPPRHVKRCLRQVMLWMADQELIELGDAGMGMTLPVRMAIGHAHFEAVHPFSDGNGRVGRMLLALQMTCKDKLPLYLSGFIELNKRDYGDVLAQTQKKLRYGPIVEFLCDAIIASHREAEQTKSAILELPSQWERRGSFRKDSAALRALELLGKNPIFTVKQLEKALKVSPPAANRAVQQLVDAKIVRERTGYERNRVFAAEEVIELLSRSFADDPAIALKKARNLLRASTGASV